MRKTKHNILCYAPRKDFHREFFELRCGRFRLSLGKRTCIMGVLNVTPDSFSDGGQFLDRARAIEGGLRMAQEGADIIDVGGESTRPGSIGVSEEEELKRVLPVIKRLAKSTNVPISIDTSKSRVAQAALDNGAVIVNDVTGLRGDPKLAEVIAKYKAGCIIMHIKGTPRTMQRAPKYKDLINEIIDWLKSGVRLAKDSGVDEAKIVVDPGIGFGKTLTHNLQILNSLKAFKKLGRPIMLGTSRKSFIGKILDLPVEERLFGTAATVAAAIGNGAHIVRVHDVGPMVQVARMVDAIMNLKKL